MMHLNMMVVAVVVQEKFDNYPKIVVQGLFVPRDTHNSMEDIRLDWLSNSPEDMHTVVEEVPCEVMKVAKARQPVAHEFEVNLPEDMI